VLVSLTLAALLSLPVDELTDALHAAFAATDAEARTRAVAAAVALAEGRTLEGVLELIQAGPVLAEDAAAPREVAGKLEEHKTIGRTTFGYSFEDRGHVYRYAVDVPRDYDSRTPAPLLIDPGHGSGKDQDAEGKAGFVEYFRGAANAAGGRDWLVVRTQVIEEVGGDGSFEEKPEDEIVHIFDLVFRDLCTRFHVDLDHVYIGGLSQTGFWTWYLAAARPDRFAAIVPMAAVTWQVEPFLANVVPVPTYVLHGDQDEICPVEPVRATTRRLAQLGGEVLYDEVTGAGHDGGVFGRFSKALEWAAERARDPYPARISKSLGSLTGGGWAFWLRVDALEREDSGKAHPQRVATGGIDAVIEGQTVRLYSEGVRRVTVCFAAELLDLEKPVEVLWNGKSVHSGKLRPSLEAALTIAAEKCDWSALFPAFLALECPGG